MSDTPPAVTLPADTPLADDVTTTAIDWAAARLAFETTPEHPVDIARRLGLEYHVKLYGRARKDRWTPYPGTRDPGQRAATAPKGARRTPRSALMPSTPSTPQTLRPATRPATRKPKRQQMIERLYRVIDNNLSQLEDIMTTQSDPSIADNEKETRTIGTVIGNIEKLKGLEDDAGKSRHSTKSTPAADAAETERVRRELAERFYKLSQELRT
jgi:hypothetical protein